MTSDIADIWLYEFSYYVQALSTSSVAVGTGAKTFVLTEDITFEAGITVTAANPDSAGANSMTGTVTSYTSATKTLVLNITSTAGSGTQTAWTIGGTGVFRVCTGKGYVTGASESPANAKYYPRIQKKGDLERSLFRPGATYGRATVGTGAVTVNNADRKFDKTLKWDFSGRDVYVKKGKQTDLYASMTTLLRGVTTTAEHSWRTITFNIGDRLASIFDKPAQTVRYDGSNSLPAGVEGVAGDLKGKPKPILKGKVENISPPLVNTSKQTYEISYRQINSIDAVYHGGVAVTAGTGYASIALLQAAATTAGTYDWYLGSGSDGAYIRLGTAVTKQVTVDATEGANAAARTVAQIAKWFILNPAGVSSGDLSASSVTALDSANSAVIGIWVGPDETTVGQVLDEVLNTCSAGIFQNRTGTFSLAQMASPTGTSVYTLNKYMLIDNLNGVERVSSNNANDGIPPPYCVVNYRKNYTVQSTTDISAAALSRMGFAVLDYRNAKSAVNNDVVTKYLLAVPWVFNSLFTAETDAQTEADRLETLYGNLGKQRETIKVRCETRYTLTLDLNSIVTIDLPAYDWNGGKKFVIIDMEEDYDGNKNVLTLWG